MNSYEYAMVDRTAEDAVVALLDLLFHDVALMSPPVVRHNIQAESMGGFPAADRTFRKATTDYLLDEFMWIYIGLLSNTEFRETFIDAIGMEQNYDDESPKKQEKIRKTMNAGLKGAAAGPTVHLDLSAYNDRIYQEIKDRLVRSIRNTDGYDKVIAQFKAEQTRDCQEEIGFIVSNFGYLLRAFEQNGTFFLYVSEVLKRVHESLGA